MRRCGSLTAEANPVDFRDLIRESEHRCLSLDDIAAFCANSALPLEATLDSCALELAEAHAAGAVSFEAGDNFANLLFAFAANQGSIPDLMFSVYLAFDAGEFFPDELRTPSPEERFTRPQRAEILRRNGAVESPGRGS